MHVFKSIRVLGALMALLLPWGANAAGVYRDNCPGGNGAQVPFSGPNASPGRCILDFPAVGNTPGTATPTIVNTTAGLDFFNNGIGMVYDTSALDQLQGETYTFILVTFPTWDPNVLSVPTFLGLQGTVQIPDTTGALQIVLTGVLGGVAQTISVDLNHANCAQCVLSMADYGTQLPFPIAVETLSLSSVGRVVYRTSDPEFVGAAPEPGTVILLLGGIAAIVIRKLRRYK